MFGVHACLSHHFEQLGQVLCSQTKSAYSGGLWSGVAPPTRRSPPHSVINVKAAIRHVTRRQLNTPAPLHSVFLTLTLV